MLLYVIVKLFRSCSVLQQYQIFFSHHKKIEWPTCHPPDWRIGNLWNYFMWISSIRPIKGRPENFIAKHFMFKTAVIIRSRFIVRSYDCNKLNASELHFILNRITISNVRHISSQVSNTYLKTKLIKT